MSGITGSALPRRQLGRHLRTLRKGAGLTVAKAAVAVQVSTATINRIEAGQTGLKDRDVRAFCETYEAPRELTEFLISLANETRSRGWWQSSPDIVSNEFSLYVGLEEAARALLNYESELVPGLLQTAGYTRAVIAMHYPKGLLHG